MSSNIERTDRLKISATEYMIVVALALLARLTFFYLTDFTTDDARFLDRDKPKKVFASGRTEYHLYRFTQNELDKPG